MRDAAVTCAALALAAGIASLVWRKDYSSYAWLFSPSATKRRPREDGAPRVVCIHAMEGSLVPTKAAFAGVGDTVTVINVLDDSLAVDVVAQGQDRNLHNRFSELGKYAVEELRADAILFSCSAFGSCIERVQREQRNVPVLKPNEALQRAVVARGGTVVVLSIFEPTLPSLARELAELAASETAALHVVTHFVPDALGLLRSGDGDKCAELIARARAGNGDFNVSEWTRDSRDEAPPKVDSGACRRATRRDTRAHHRGSRHVFHGIRRARRHEGPRPRFRFCGRAARPHVPRRRRGGPPGASPLG